MPGLTRVTGSRTLSTLTTQAVTIGGTLATFWAAFAANLVTGGALIQYGVIRGRPPVSAGFSLPHSSTAA